MFVVDSNSEFVVSELVFRSIEKDAYAQNHLTNFKSSWNRTNYYPFFHELGIIAVKEPLFYFPNRLIPSLKIFYFIFVFSRMSEEVFEASPSITKRKWRRVHGLQWPWHPQQVVAWLILIYFTLFTFCVVIPSFNRNAAIVLTGQYFQTSFHSRIHKC